MRFASKDLAIFYQQLGTMIEAGVAIQNALGSLQKTSPRPMRPILEQLTDGVNRGDRLYEAMSRHSNRFRPLDYQSLAIAEQSGGLDVGLFALASYHSKRAAARGKMIGASILPVLIFVAAIFVTSFPNLILGAMGMINYTTFDYLRDTVGVLGLLVFCLVACVMLCKGLFRVPALALTTDQMLRWIPVFGGLRFNYALIQWTQSIRLMLKAGYGMVEALEYSSRMAGSPLIAHAYAKVRPHINSQLDVSQLLAATGVFPPILTQLWGTGEQSGRMDEMLEKVVQYCEESWHRSLDRVAEWLPRIVYALVVVFVAIQVFKLLGPLLAQYRDALQM